MVCEERKALGSRLAGHEQLDDGGMYGSSPGRGQGGRRELSNVLVSEGRPVVLDFGTDW